jgi:hypothetical protein
MDGDEAEEGELLFELLEYFEGLSSGDTDDASAARAYDELSALRQRAVKLFSEHADGDGDGDGDGDAVEKQGQQLRELPHGAMDLHGKFVGAFEGALDGFVAARGLEAPGVLALVRAAVGGDGGGGGGGVGAAWAAEAGKELVQLCHEAGDFAAWAASMQRRGREVLMAGGGSGGGGSFAHK